jgi:hypothetical protein
MAISYGAVSPEYRWSARVTAAPCLSALLRMSGPPAVYGPRDVDRQRWIKGVNRFTNIFKRIVTNMKRRKEKVKIRPAKRR